MFFGLIFDAAAFWCDEVTLWAKLFVYKHQFVNFGPDCSIRTIKCTKGMSLPRDYKGDREGIPLIHPIPQVIRLELFLTPQISRGIRQQPIT